jgi:hypothetical protein
MCFRYETLLCVTLHDMVSANITRCIIPACLSDQLVFICLKLEALCKFIFKFLQRKIFSEFKYGLIRCTALPLFLFFLIRKLTKPLNAEILPGSSPKAGR